MTDGKKRVCPKRETAKKWEWVPVQLYDSRVGLVHRALQWPTECCWNENHIGAARFLPHITSPLPVSPSLSHIPSSMPYVLCGSGLAVVWFSLVNYNLWSWLLFWNALLSIFDSSFPFFFFEFSLKIRPLPVSHCSMLCCSSYYDTLLSNSFKKSIVHTVLASWICTHM